MFNTQNKLQLKINSLQIVEVPNPRTTMNAGQQEEITAYPEGTTTPTSGLDISSFIVKGRENYLL